MMSVRDTPDAEDPNMPDEPALPEVPDDLPLHRAARFGDIAMLEQLVREGADINARTGAVDGWFVAQLTPLMVAARSMDGADVETLAWLLDHGADLYATSEDGVTAAWYAAGMGERNEFDPWQPAPDHVDRLRFLLDAGLDPHESMFNGCSLLVEACRAGDPARVRLLLERGVSLSGHLPGPGRAYFQIPLFGAAKSGSADCVQLLLDAGADIHEATEMDARTALSYAASPEIARLLIAVGARIDVHDRYEDVLGHLLDEADEGESDAFAVAEVLLEAGASLDYGTDKNWSRLYYAAFRNQAPVVEWLLAQGASQASDNTESTPLHAICWQGEYSEEEWAVSCERVVRTLVAAGIPIEARDNEGRTPLHKAAGGDWGNSVAARTLLELGAEPDPMDGYGQTPLHLAAGNGYLYCVEALLAAGADPLRPDVKGITPLAYAAEPERQWRLYAANNAPSPGIMDAATRQEFIERKLHEAIAGRAALAAAAGVPLPLENSE